jgi:hypothetical protein
MAEARLNVVANPLINITLQGRHDTYPKRRGMTRVKEQMARGLTVAFGHDCVMDPWYPLGSGDMLEVAQMGLHVGQMTSLDEMRACYRAVTDNAAQILGLDGYGVAPGCYADLVVHRALLATAARGGEALAATGEHISATERRAAAAERAALDRYRASLLGGAIGTSFTARITGVAPFGLFVTLPESGADGLIPISSLPSDYYDHEAARHRLVGRRSDRIFALGDAATVTLVEADAIGGRLVFRIEGEAFARPRRGLYRRRR